MALRVLIADDHRMIRQGLRTLLERETDFEVVGEAQDGRSAVAMIGELAPDLVVMDVRMPDLNGIEATRQALIARTSVKIVALSAESSDHLCQEILKAGARGYVVKEAAFEELVNALRVVASGAIYLSPAIAKLMGNGNGASNSSPSASIFNSLSAREREVIQLIAEGMATKEIAHHLDVSVKTIETHRRNLMEKLGLDSVAALTKYAIREGVTPL